MSGYEDKVPAYLMARVVRQEGPIAAFAEQEAWQARNLYPELMGVGLPEFFHAREREAGGWELSEYGSDTPQGARDGLGARFRTRAEETEDAGHEDARHEDARHEEAGHEEAGRTWMRAATRLDREVVDEMRVLGERFRIVRASRFIRMGDSGPEPPRPSDPDPAEVGESHMLPDRDKGFVVDPFTGTGLSEGILKLDLARFVGRISGAPPEVAEDARRAVERCPGGVLLPATFMISERRDGSWTAHAGGRLVLHAPGRPRRPRRVAAGDGAGHAAAQ
jgi:hypothetical protein